MRRARGIAPTLQPSQSIQENKLNKMSNWYLRLAVLYFVAGVAMGIGMAASQNHSMAPVHAHVNLLGWVSLSLFGLFYRVVPEAAASKLAQAQFWLYVPAHLVQMLALAALYCGYPGAEPVLGIASTLVALGVLCFATVVWQHTRTAK
jgi:hypothetical protein